MSKRLEDILFQSFWKNGSRVLATLEKLEQLDTSQHKEIILNTLIEFNTIYASEFLIFYSRFYKKLNLNDWIDIFINLKDKPLSLYYLSSFMYKYLKVDFTNHFINMDTQLTQHLNNIFKTRIGGFIYYPTSIENLNYYKVELDFLVNLGKQLIEQGAEPAKDIPYTITELDIKFKNKDD